MSRRLPNPVPEGSVKPGPPPPPPTGERPIGFPTRSPMDDLTGAIRDLIRTMREDLQEEIQRLSNLLSTPKTNRGLGMDILGKEARDKVTGFSGIVIGRCEYLFGCTQYGISPKVTEKNPEPTGASWFDEGRIEVVGSGIAVEEVAGEKPGGPSRDAPSAY